MMNAIPLLNTWITDSPVVNSSEFVGALGRFVENGGSPAELKSSYRTEDVEHFLGIMRYEWEAFLKQKQLKLELEAMRSIQKTKRQKSWWQAHTREVSSGVDEAPVLFHRLACVLVLIVVML